jgi:hypothetical protein
MTPESLHSEYANCPGTYSQWVGSSQSNFDLKDMVLTHPKDYSWKKWLKIARFGYITKLAKMLWFDFHDGFFV